MQTITTTKLFERRNAIDNQLHTMIPVGIKLQVEEIMQDYYKITASKPITKGRGYSINVSRQELDAMQS